MNARSMMRAALVLLALFAVVHLFGFRDATSFLSGTTGSGDLSWEASVIVGSIYLTLYFGAVLAAPILLIASAFTAAAELLIKRKPS